MLTRAVMTISQRHAGYGRTMDDARRSSAPPPRSGVVIGPSRNERYRAAERRIELISHLMDDLIPIPGTGQRIGLDPVIGLVPGIGDLIGAIAGVWVIVEAARFGIPAIVLLRMCWNAGVDMVVGVIPVLGDLFDVVSRSNRRNLELFRRHALDPAASTSEQWLFLGGIGLVVLAIAWLVWSALGALLSVQIPGP
jgi:hypothetical protein